MAQKYGKTYFKANIAGGIAAHTAWALATGGVSLYVTVPSHIINLISSSSMAPYGGGKYMEQEQFASNNGPQTAKKGFLYGAWQVSAAPIGQAALAATLAVETIMNIPKMATRVLNEGAVHIKNMTGKIGDTEALDEIRDMPKMDAHDYKYSNTLRDILRRSVLSSPNGFAHRTINKASLLPTWKVWQKTYSY